MTLRFRTVFWSAAGVIVAALLVWGFLPRPVPVDFAEAVREDLVVSVRDEGYTRVRDVYVVSAPVGGRLLRVEAEAGDAVAAGDALVRLLPSDPAFLDARSQAEAQAALRSAEAGAAFAEAQLARAEAEADYARAEARRAETLFERGTISEGALDRARLELRSAEAALATARADLRVRRAERDAAEARLVEPGAAGEAEGLVTLESPIDGVVLRVLQESEAVVAPGQAVLELGDPSALEIVAELLSTDAVKVQAGAPAEILAWGGEPALSARVRRVEPFGFLKVSALGVEEQRVNVILDFTDPPDRWAGLGHGFRVEPAIEVWRGEDVVTAPVASLFRHEAGWAAFVVEDGRARLRPVALGRNDGRRAEIVEGLEAGETLVLYPSDQVRDGARVEERPDGVDG